MPTPPRKPDTKPDPDTTGAAGDVDQAEEGPAPTHVHMLADGSSVETASPVATEHYSEKSGHTVPVVSTFEIGKD